MVKANRIVRTDRLDLEPIRAEHAAELFSILSDQDLYRFIPIDPPVSVSVLATRYERLAGQRSPDGREIWLNWAVRVRESGVVAGLLEATIHPADDTALVAYMVGTAYQGVGIATEGCAEMLRLLVDEYGVGVIAAEIDTRNARSIALVERLGFARVTTMRDVDVFKGVSSDEYRYELRSQRSEMG